MRSVSRPRVKATIRPGAGSTEKVIELVKGQRRASSRKFYPGYILVQMDLNDETWHLVRHTPKVTGFIGSQEKPIPLSDAKPKP